MLTLGNLASRVSELLSVLQGKAGPGSHYLLFGPELCEGKFFIMQLFKKILFTFRERGREEEREGKKHPCVAASRLPPPGDLACNPGMCPDWE